MNGRILLNANMHKSNVVDFDDYLDIAISTYEDIQENILPLCGKNAMLDLVVFREDANNYLNNVFSNDGIHVLKSIEYANPLQTFISNYIRYIAERVEKSAADGTSTAIYLSSALMKCVMYAIQDDKNFQVRTHNNDLISQQQTVKVFKDITIDFIKYLKTYLKNCLIDINTLSQDEKRQVIYNLAYTTSKGNEYLSECAVELFANIPEILYKYVDHKRSPNETDDDISIKEADCDFTIKIVPSANTVYNTNLGTELQYDNCNLILIPQVNHANADALIAYLNESVDETPVIVITNGGDDSVNVLLERQLNRDNTTYLKYVAHVDQFINNPLELNVLQVVAGKRKTNPLSVKDFDDIIIKNVSCHMVNRELKISGLFSHETSPIHPNYYNNDNQDYTDLRLEIESRINILESAHNLRNAQEILNEFVRIYKSLVCSRLSKLCIGGASVDHIYNINIVNDVLGVVSVALKYGIVIDGMIKLRIIIQEWLNDFNRCNDGDYLNGIIAFAANIDHFNAVCYENDKIICDDVRDESFDEYSMLEDERWVTVNLAKDKNVVMQSFKAFDELFDRLIETIPKLICVNRVIVKDGIVDKEGD